MAGGSANGKEAEGYKAPQGRICALTEQVGQREQSSQTLHPRRNPLQEGFVRAGKLALAPKESGPCSRAQWSSRRVARRQRRLSSPAALLSRRVGPQKSNEGNQVLSALKQCAGALSGQPWRESRLILAGPVHRKVHRGLPALRGCACRIHAGCPVAEGGSVLRGHRSTGNVV